MEMAAVFFDSVKQTLYLSQIDEAGDDEIDARLQPQRMIFVRNVVKTGPHIIDPHISIDAERNWEKVGDDLPEFRDGAPWPGDAGDEKHRDRYEDKQHDAVLPSVNEGGEHHREEDAGEDERYDECNECTVMPQLWQPEGLRDIGEHVDAHDEVEKNVNQCLSQYDVYRILVAPAQWDDAAPVLFPRSAHRHADS